MDVAKRDWVLDWIKRGVAGSPAIIGSATPTTASALRPACCRNVFKLFYFVVLDCPFLDAYQKGQAMFDFQLLDGSGAELGKFLQERHDGFFEKKIIVP